MSHEVRQDGDLPPLQPQRAVVAPRVRLERDGAPRRIEDEVRRVLSASGARQINVWGPPGSGKTTALRHLAAVLPGDLPVRLLDFVPTGLDSSHVTVFTSYEPMRMPGFSCLELAPWTDDDLIEYMLAAHRGRCRSVIPKVTADPSRPGLGGSPALWSVILDQMAADESLGHVDEALARHLDLELCDTNHRREAQTLCLHRLVPGAAEPRSGFCLDPRLFTLLACPPVQHLLAAQRIVEDLAADAETPHLRVPLPQELVERIGVLADPLPVAIRRLHQLAQEPLTQSMAMSILNVLGLAPQPRAGQLAVLTRAFLANVNWPGVMLDRGRLEGTTLANAVLTGAFLSDVHAGRAQLSGADLRGARIGSARFHWANLERADLSGSTGDGCDFSNARLIEARLDGANLRDVRFQYANLTRASLIDARLHDANFDRARIAGADFSGADLRGAILRFLPLRTARFTSADMRGCDLRQSDMEGMELTGARLNTADLSGARLTAARMPHSDLRGAKLCGARLAEVDWRHADLRGADLQGASFHMGSTRSGLVGSTLPCEGSRTGFYTDEYHDRQFKDPREIRKADLRGADLRGAKIEKTDFYLIDLRGARYTRQQAEHLRQCGAILCRQG